MRQAVSLFKLLLCLIWITCFISCKKNTTVSRLPGGPSDVKIIKDVKYGSNRNLQGNIQNLALDIYMPADLTPSEKLPLILFVHGGGFVAGDKGSAAFALQKFAEAGFVGVSIDYRVDSSADGSVDPCTVDTTVTQRALYMSVQDTRAALRFMVANADKYNIDTSRIFLDGNSAGAITVLNSHFLKQADFNALIPGIESELGGIDNADNAIRNTYSIIGIGANSGCLPNPNYITSSNVVPVIFFHGGLDSVIPINRGHAYYCPGTLYVYGSATLYNRVSDLDEATVIHVAPDGGHGPYAEDFLTDNEICFFNSVISSKVERGYYSALQSSCH